MISINKLVEIIASIAQKEIQIQNISGPTGVAGRTSDNTLIKQMLNWDYIFSLEKGLELTYSWIKNQVSASNYKEPT